MTVIVAIRTRKNVVMGCDSARVNGWLELFPEREKKCFYVGRFLIGMSGSARGHQLLQYGDNGRTLANLKPKQDAFRFMVTEFVPEMRLILTSGGYAEVKDNVEGAAKLWMLVAWGRHLFHVWGNFQVSHPADSYIACGCGASLATGSLYSTRWYQNPKDRIREALGAAERYSAGVAKPFHFFET